MLKAWVFWMSKNGWKKVEDKYYASITSLFRTYEDQERVKKQYGDAAATPGRSPHGWGIAVDFQFYTKSGSLIPNSKNTDKYFKEADNPAIIWLYDNSYKYGFVPPVSLRDKKGLDEHWHFEYHGTCAKSIMEANPTIYGHTVKVNDDVLDIVKNPLNPDGTRAVYKTCEYTYVADSADGGDASTKISDATKAQNQVDVKNYFKKLGLSKEATAGIMGNIQKESTFNPTALNPKDSNGLPSYGLIQWNQNTATKQEVGDTVQSQLKYLSDWSRFKTYTKKLIDLANSGERADAREAAYYFAKIVEVCGGCTTTYDEFLKNPNSIRSDYASDFMDRFKNKKDKLYW
jgi:hypothetical protein